MAYKLHNYMDEYFYYLIMDSLKKSYQYNFPQYGDKESSDSFNRHLGRTINNNTIYIIDDIITVNSEMLAVKEKIKRAAASSSSVLIYGKAGTGKEMVAQSIHNCSRRCSNPFVSINCASIPSTLLESNLFGTVKGSFTGAEDRGGLFEAANQGTLFLDEINSMDPMMQVKILKAIEEKRIRRVGGTKQISLDVKIIAALNQDPMELIKKGKLRKDLFFRLSVIEIDIPPLKERKDDIEYLTKYFIDYYNEDMEKDIKGISEEAKEVFKEYDWPGNVRELKNIIEGAFNNTEDDIISIDDIPERLLKEKRNRQIRPPIEFDANNVGLQEYLEECERRIIFDTIEKHGGNMAAAARDLRISRQLLYYKLKRHI